MIQCTKCRAEIVLNGPAQEAIRRAVTKVESTAMMSLPCPSCKAKVQISAGQLRVIVCKDTAPVSIELERPPAAPKLNWANMQHDMAEETIRRPSVLMAMHTPVATARVQEALASMDYEIVEVKTSREALQRLTSEDFECVIIEDQFDNVPLEKDSIHIAITQLPQERRRSMLYIAIGPKFRTLYSLDAIVCSANAVISTSDASSEDHNRIAIVIRHAITDIEKTYSKFIQELQNSKL